MSGRTQPFRARSNSTDGPLHHPAGKQGRSRAPPVLQDEVAEFREPSQADAEFLTRGRMPRQLTVRSIQAAQASILYAERLAPTVAPGALEDLDDLGVSNHLVGW